MTTFTDSQIDQMIALAKNGASFQDIADAMGEPRRVIYNTFGKHGLSLMALQWGDDGWRGKLLIQLHRQGLPIDAMATKLKASHRTVRAHLDARGLRGKQTYVRVTPPPSASKSKGKGRKQDRVAAAIYAPPDIVPPHAMGIERTPRPTGCAHVMNDPSNWQRVHYCNRKPRKGTMLCPAHSPFKRKEEAA